MLFCAGGGSILFDAIPMNFLGDKTSASYANTGYWSNRAVNEAKIVCPKLHIATEVKVSLHFKSQKNENGLIYVPDFEEWSKSDESAYLHYCDNETVEGLEYQFLPKIPGTPLIADMSSNFLTRRANWD
jgi:phosphoserine aminotransferase